MGMDFPRTHKERNQPARAMPEFMVSKIPPIPGKPINRNVIRVRLRPGCLHRGFTDSLVPFDVHPVGIECG